MRRIVAASLLLVTAALPAPALAAPPANDQRAAAQPLALPAGVSGTTRESTLEPDEPSSCAAAARIRLVLDPARRRAPHRGAPGRVR